MTHKPGEITPGPEAISHASNLKKVVVRWACLGVALLSIVIGITGALRLDADSILHAFGLISAKDKAVLLEFNHFPRVAKLVANYTVDEQNRFPPTTLKEYFQIPFPDKDLVFGKNNHRTFYYLERGIDPWGSPFVFDSKLCDRGQGSYTLILTIRCVGSNGRDENGQGDDNQRIIEYPFFLGSPTTP